MKCPKCGNPMKQLSAVDTANYIKRRLFCKPCNHYAVTYEFFAADLPSGFTASGTRVLIGDNFKDIVPGICAGTIESLYPHIAIDDDGRLQGKRIVEIPWGVKEL